MRRSSSEIVVGGLFFCVSVFIAQAGCNAITQASDLRVSGEPTGTGSSTTTSSASGGPNPGDNGSTSSASSGGGGTSASSSASSGSTGSTGSTGAPADSGSGGCPKPETDLVAYYPLDEVGGTVVHDCSGNNYDGTVISQHNQMWTTAGQFGNAFSATASAGCIDLGGVSALKPEAGNFSVAAWVRVVAFGGGGNPHYVFGRTALPDSAGWRLGTDVGNAFGTKLYAQTSGLLLVTSAGQHPTNVWTHVAATYSKNGSVSLYVSGAPAGSSALTQIVPDDTATLRIGCRGDNGGYFDGAIDEVRLYARALTSAEIAALAARTP